MQPIISIKNLSKQYRLGTVGTGTLSNDLKRWWYNVRGKEDPFLKIGETNVRSSKGDSEYVWALKDISFDVMPGEVLGIIGKNGAGKSTLLKILSKVTGPTTGSIDYNGRIGSLLEVGTGFHPELTGRENIYLNGAILGMTKPEIRSKLDEIIDFAGVSRYIDTPVKRYSSGMTVRLGFAIAAHLEPEILVVDEVLAVGDAEFQKKAIGKMQDVSNNEGRTVLFVSHNMGAVKNLCQKGVVLSDGGIYYIGNVDEAIGEYFRSVGSGFKYIPLSERKDRRGTGESYFIDMKVLSGDKNYVSTGDDITFEFLIDKYIPRLECTFTIYDVYETRVAVTNSAIISEKDTVKKREGINKEVIYRCNIKNLNLKPGDYIVNVALTYNNHYIDHIEKAFQFKVHEGLLNMRMIKDISNSGVIAFNHTWEKYI